MPPFEPRCDHGIPFSQYCPDCADEDGEYEDDYDPDWDEDEEDWYDDPSDPNEGMR